MYMTPEEIREKFPDAAIGRHVVIGSGVVIGRHVVIESHVRIRSHVVIERNAMIGSCAVIGSGVVIESCAVIKSDVRIGSGAWIKSGAWIGSGAVIGVNRKGVTHALVINGIGTTRRMTAHTSKEGLVIVIGCLNGHRGATIEQARKAIAQKYSPDHAYFAASDLAQRWYDQLEYTNTN